MINGDAVAIKVEGVSKKYCKSLKTSMFYGMKDITRNSLGLSSHPEKLRKGEFWAVSNISLDVKKGETLGIIGPNGAGKTTLLKMLNGIFWPDKGKITIKGKVGALIEVGAGFHPLLTGRENIYINAAILGMTKKEVDKHFSSIVEFADIDEFLDAPVKHYSSGMFVRLGFSIAVHSNPDVLLIDEILAVGDLGFRVKCYNKIVEMAKKCAVVIVTHDMSTIARLSSKSIVINDGMILFAGSPDIAIQRYSAIFQKDKTIVDPGGISLVDFSIDKKSENGHFVTVLGAPMKITLTFASEWDNEYITLILAFVHSSGEFVAEYNSWLNGEELRLPKGSHSFNVTSEPLWLNPGIYHLSLVITTRNRMEHLLVIDRMLSLFVNGERVGNAPYQIAGNVTCECLEGCHI
ncbi:MAG: polysaccharide ABC transporter ATP-binding protein [Proteobacteria bacterium]|nr:polysaccharide ABC transporter ATP-binding protein [Pseudomonadota bacterium]